MDHCGQAGHFFKIAVCLILSMICTAGCITGVGDEPLPKDAVDGTLFSGWSKYPAVSGDGRIVAFVTGAEDPVHPFRQYSADIIIRDRENGEFISLRNSSGLPEEYTFFTNPSLSADGRYCAFESGSRSSLSEYVLGETAHHNIFVFDRENGRTACVSVASDDTRGNDQSIDPVISDDGRYVTFSSWATNLVDDDSNADVDVFFHDRQTGETTRISPGYGLSYPSSLSGDGSVVVFASADSGLVEGDTNGETDVFVWNRLTREITRVSVASDGTGGNGSSLSPDISTNGCFVSFRSTASNLLESDDNEVGDIFIHDLTTGETIRARDAAVGTFELGWSRSPPLSGDGRYVAFESMAENLVEGDNKSVEDVFVFDKETKETTLISIASDGVPGNGNSNAPDLSADGRYVIFVSEATNLVNGDDNGYADVFVHDLQTGRTTLVSCFPKPDSSL